MDTNSIDTNNINTDSINIDSINSNLFEQMQLLNLLKRRENAFNKIYALEKMMALEDNKYLNNYISNINSDAKTNENIFSKNIFKLSQDHDEKIQKQLIGMFKGTLLKNIIPIKITHLTRIKTLAPIKIVSRSDLVGQYVGHTCEKTKKVLSNTLEEGKVLFIDEAYSLVLDHRDSFGQECLHELNRFMSENPELIVIFAGYKEKMEETLFKFQLGFKRRCTWMFEINNYTPEDLAIIFTKQLKQQGWSYCGTIQDLTAFFKENMKDFANFGGDTLRLALYCKLKYSELEFDSGVKSNSKKITLDIIKEAYTETYCLNQHKEALDDDRHNYSMYM